MTPHLTSWRGRSGADLFQYADARALETAIAKLRTLPPLVTSWEVERLKQLLALAQEGKRFLLQAGECVETTDCVPSSITQQLRVLLQISLVLAHAFQAPIVRVGRLAGHYSTPASLPTEEREGVVLPSYFGDNVNRAEFTAEARAPDPQLLLRAHMRAALTLNFVRSLLASDFADMHHTDYWRLRDAAIAPALQGEYHVAATALRNGLRFVSAISDREISELTRADLYTGHEGLHLEYEAAQTVTVPRREGWYALSTHLPWIGDRRRSLSGAHVEFFRHLKNPIAVKLGPSCEPAEVVELIEALNPEDEPGRMTLVTCLGARNVAERLPPLVEAVTRTGRRVLWVTDPMEGNKRRGAEGHLAPHFEDVLAEIRRSFEVHDEIGTRVGGLHLELTGEGVPSSYLGLTYEQALETSFVVSRLLEPRRIPSMRP